jgi:hypothetical protein
MKRKLLLLVIFIMGTLAGFVSCFLWIGFKDYSVMGHFASMNLTEIAIDAREIRAGRANGVLERYDKAIPQLILNFDKFYSKVLSEEEINRTLWGFQRYYSDNPSLEVPAEIKPILDALPPRPLTSCEIKALKEKDSNVKPD